MPSSDLLEDDFANLEADTRRRRPELLLTVASALLLVGNVLLILAVFLNFVGSVGGWDGSKTIWVAFGMDLVGVTLLGRAFLVTASQAEGRSRLYRLAAGSLLLLWVGLTAFWRFGLPAVMGTNIQDLFLTLITSQAGVPVRIMRYLTVVYEILSLWILSAFVFVLAHVMRRSVVGRFPRREFQRVGRRQDDRRPEHLHHRIRLEPATRPVGGSRPLTACRGLARHRTQEQTAAHCPPEGKATITEGIVHVFTVV